MLQGSWGSLITFGVLLAGGVIADRMGALRLQRRVLLFLAVFLVVFNAISFAWRYDAVATSGLLIWSVADPFYSVAAFPILMTLCRRTIEGSQFTAYMALINLSVNARDAMPDGGTLTISVDTVADASEAGLAPGRYVRLLVADAFSTLSRSCSFELSKSLATKHSEREPSAKPVLTSSKRPKNMSVSFLNHAYPSRFHLASAFGMCIIQGNMSTK